MNIAGMVRHPESNTGFRVRTNGMARVKRPHLPYQHRVPQGHVPNEVLTLAIALTIGNHNDIDWCDLRSRDGDLALAEPPGSASCRPSPSIAAAHQDNHEGSRERLLALRATPGPRPDRDAFTENAEVENDQAVRESAIVAAKPRCAPPG
jgi:hypothetical protein